MSNGIRWKGETRVTWRRPKHTSVTRRCGVRGRHPAFGGVGGLGPRDDVITGRRLCRQPSPCRLVSVETGEGRRILLEPMSIQRTPVRLIRVQPLLMKRTRRMDGPGITHGDFGIILLESSGPCGVTFTSRFCSLLLSLFFSLASFSWLPSISG